MEEVIQKILEAIKENQEHWLEIEFAEIKNEEPDAEDLEEYSLDAYNEMHGNGNPNLKHGVPQEVKRWLTESASR